MPKPLAPFLPRSGSNNHSHLTNVIVFEGTWVGMLCLHSSRNTPPALLYAVYNSNKLMIVTYFCPWSYFFVCINGFNSMHNLQVGFESLFVLNSNSYDILFRWLNVAQIKQNFLHWQSFRYYYFNKSNDSLYQTQQNKFHISIIWSHRSLAASTNIWKRQIL